MRLQLICTIAIVAVLSASCSKQDEFLDERYNLSDVVPETVADFQALLDNDVILNNNTPAMPLMSADNFYVSDVDVLTLNPEERNAYLWSKDIFQGNNNLEWSSLYTIVAYANTVLDGLIKLGAPADNLSGYNNVKGSALFYRAYAFYNLTQMFTKPYSASAGTDLGLPLRTSSDVNVRPIRATLAETYEKILTDLAAAADLLPNLGAKINRPSKAAVYALMAKTFLLMADYPQAETYASKALALKSSLLDYNTVQVGFFPFINYSLTNPEYVFYATSCGYAVFNPMNVFLTDTTLYNSYEQMDVRKGLFYTVIAGPPDKIYFRGSYTIGLFFGGLATNELYLIKAEALIRQNKVTEGMDALNILLANRYTPPFTPKTAANTDEALDQLLSERRKELPFTSQIRWEDLRRLNQDPARAITLKRVVNGSILTLPPGDARYVFPIPDPEIRLSGIEQNNR